MRNWTRFLLIGAACAVMTPLSAQTQSRPDPADIYILGKLTDRSAVIQSQALDHPGIGLTGAQQGEIHRIVDTYLQEQSKLDEKYPRVEGKRPSAEFIQARQAVTVTMTRAVTKLLDPAQFKAWREAMGAQRKPRDLALFIQSGGNPGR